MWGAVAGTVINNNTQYELAVSVHDSVYNTDFASMILPYNPNNPDKNAKEIEQSVLQTFRKFSIEHLCKFLGVGITLSLLKEVGIAQIAIKITHLTYLISSPPISAPVYGWTWTWCLMCSTSRLSIPIPSLAPISGTAFPPQRALMFP